MCTWVGIQEMNSPLGIRDETYMVQWKDSFIFFSWMLFAACGIMPNLKSIMADITKFFKYVKYRVSIVLSGFNMSGY